MERGKAVSAVARAVLCKAVSQLGCIVPQDGAEGGEVPGVNLCMRGWGRGVSVGGVC